MANIKSAKKRAKTNEVRRKRNVARRSDVKSATKKVLAAVQANALEKVHELLKEAESKIARAKAKGVMKKNTANRKISRLAKKITQKGKEKSI